MPSYQRKRVGKRERARERTSPRDDKEGAERKRQSYRQREAGEAERGREEHHSALPPQNE
jgi:hypothetical protein